MYQNTEKTDVVIIGAGPAGHMLAACLARQGVKCRIVDKRGTGVFNGQADGLNLRSMELFESLGFLPKIAQYASPLNSFSHWFPGSDGVLTRTSMDLGTLLYSQPVFSRHVQYALNQGYIERLLAETLERYSDTKVERAIMPVSLDLSGTSPDPAEAYPVRVTFQHLTEEEAAVFQMKSHSKARDHVPKDGLFRSNLAKSNTGELLQKIGHRKETEEVVSCKYVVGCDGAWSWTREQLGIKLEGEQTDVVWGVIDIVPLTTFPDAREVCMIQSESGNILWIPREHGLIRIYTQLTEVKPGEDGAIDRTKITPEQILRKAQAVLSPFTVDYSYCDWWTAYQIGQRVGTAYTDPSRRVFLAGDAVHTHSPKEGLGMNTSMQDAFNLSWKLAAVINKQAPDSILETYELERRPVAQDLINFDRKISSAFSQKLSKDLIGNYFEASPFMTGIAVQYQPNTMIAKPSDQVVANNLKLGARLPPHLVRFQANDFEKNLLQLAPMDGRWRLLAFAACTSQSSPLARLNALGEHLSDPHTGLLNRLRTVVRYPLEPIFPHSMESDLGRSVQPTQRQLPWIDVLAIHALDRRAVELKDFHSAFFPTDKVLGHDYEKVLVDVDAYKGFGIDPEGDGCMILARPDQHVAWVGALEDTAGLIEFLTRCTLVR